MTSWISVGLQVYIRLRTRRRRDRSSSRTANVLPYTCGSDEYQHARSSRGTRKAGNASVQVEMEKSAPRSLLIRFEGRARQGIGTLNLEIL